MKIEILKINDRNNFLDLDNIAELKHPFPNPVRLMQYVHIMVFEIDKIKLTS
jgi:hypothetical protein